MDITWKVIIWNQFGAAVGSLRSNRTASLGTSLWSGNFRHHKRGFTWILVFMLLAIPLSVWSGPILWPDSIERVRGWQEDLDSAISVFLAKDRSFDSLARAEFIHNIRALRDSASGLSDEQIIVRLAVAVAGARNAHTRLYLLRNRTVLRRYPIRVWWFGNELYVIRTRPEQAGLLGCKVLTISGHSALEAFEQVKHLYAGNRSWLRYISTYLLTSPEILEGVGLLRGMDELRLTVEGPKGRRWEARLQPLPLERSDKPLEAWWDLAHTHPGRQGPWVSVLPADEAQLPIYLRHLERYYWFHRLPALNVLYVQYNRSQNEPDSETVSAFGDRLLRELERDPPEKLVIDLRFNTGGNLELADSLFRQIARLPLAQEAGRLFVITGRATFSAGITAVATFRQLTRAVLVGEPVGDTLDMWSEGGNIMLPNTKLTLHYANGFHSYSPREYPQFRPYQYDLSVTELGPDVPVETTIEQYLVGKDPAMEAILAFHPDSAR